MQIQRSLTNRVMSRWAANPAKKQAATSGPWLTAKQAAHRAQCGLKTIYREVDAGRLRAARVGGRRDLRIKAEWLDDWLEKAAA